MPIAAVLPAPPLAVPALVGGPDPQTAELTAACLGLPAEVRREGRPVVLLGVGPQTRVYPRGAWAGLAEGGVGSPGTVALQAAPTLSVSLTVGCWLLGRVWPGAAASLREVAVDAAPQQCAALGAGWAREHPDAVWRVLAGAVGDAPVEAEIRYAAAPFGVGHRVARWQW